MGEKSWFFFEFRNSLYGQLEFSHNFNFLLITVKLKFLDQGQKSACFNFIPNGLLVQCHFMNIISVGFYPNLTVPNVIIELNFNSVIFEFLMVFKCILGILIIKIPNTVKFCVLFPVQLPNNSGAVPPPQKKKICIGFSFFSILK